jgi:hypothetical protein
LPDNPAIEPLAAMEAKWLRVVMETASVALHSASTGKSPKSLSSPSRKNISIEPSGKSTL